MEQKEVNLKPEELSEILIWDWLKTKSHNVKEVYFNRQNKLGWKIFKVKGYQKKPDFVVCIDRGYGNEYIALEIKTAQSDRNILDSGKILDLYYDNYVNVLTQYFIDEDPIIIKHFAVASDNSIKGYLFPNEVDVWDNERADDSWRKTNAQYKLEPSKEYVGTSRFVRELWARFRRVRDKNKNKKDLPSLGILMSNFGEDDYSPHFMTMIYCSWMSKPKWGARFWKI